MLKGEDAEVESSVWRMQYEMAGWSGQKQANTHTKAKRAHKKKSEGFIKKENEMKNKGK